jgi:hypothetical protein
MMEENLKRRDFFMMIRLERYQGGSYKGAVLSEGKYPSYTLCGRFGAACCLESNDRDQGSRNVPNAGTELGQNCKTRQLNLIVPSLTLRLYENAYSLILFELILLILVVNTDRLCGLVVRVLCYKSGGPGSIPCTTRKKSSGSGTGFSLVSTAEELLDRKVAVPV